MSQPLKINNICTILRDAPNFKFLAFSEHIFKAEDFVRKLIKIHSEISEKGLCLFLITLPWHFDITATE